MATPTPILELDPIFVRALRLLHSKAKDSADQLRQMLDDALHHRPISSGITTSSSSGSRDYPSYQASVPSTKVSVKQETVSKLVLTTTKKPSPKQSDALPVSKKSSSSRDDDAKKAEKRTFDKVIKQEAIEPAGSDAKRTKLESPKLSPSPSPPLVLKIDIKKETEDFSAENWNTDADDFAMEMGLACMICRNIDVSSGNQLVECQECHNLYHQECHRPAITDQDVNDPRVVWYCAKCAKNIKKLTIKTQKTSKSIQPTIVKEPLVATKSIKVEPVVQSSATHLFKRTEIKSTLAPSSSSSSSRSSSSSSSGNKPTGLAGLAASLTGKSSSHKSSTQGGNHGSKPISKSSTALPNLTKAATSSAVVTPSPTVASQAAKGGGPFAALTSSIKSPTSSGSTISSSGVSTLSSKTSSSASSSSKAQPPSSSSGNGNGNGTGKSASSSSLMSADKRLQIMKKKAEKKKQEKRWNSK